MGWLALIASLLGTGLSMAGNAKVQRETERRVKQELLRQKGYQVQADLAYQEAAAQNTPEKAKSDQAQGTAERQQAYERANATPVSNNAVAVGNPAQVQADRINAGNANTARAIMAGFDQASLANLLRASENARRMQSVNTLSRSSNSVLPIELNAASQAGNTLQQTGSLTNLAGMLLGITNSGNLFTSQPKKV